MGRWSLAVTGRTTAPPPTVWPLVGEARRWREWSGLTTTELVRSGDPDPDGVGAVRRFGVGPASSLEEVTAWEPPRHLGYRILSGFPVRDYRADVSIEGDGSGSTVTWSATFEPWFPGAGRATHLALRAILGRFVRRLCAATSAGDSSAPRSPWRASRWRVPCPRVVATRNRGVSACRRRPTSTPASGGGVRRERNATWT